MEKPDKDHSFPKLTGQQIVQKKLDEANSMLRKMNLSRFPGRLKDKQD